ncbi:MAG: DUF2007 domain-containing protein [Candidatus Tectomicrobia bacterium]|uniref:DUF2007 domain-containing protein n=1 Tax=Tectimicrobiota bacterium TaxID=2528274 RepID=A0A933LR40_UNCTE|nr:DUF2007 domain-containing protein [Candidatus Tectomicrobia bacterium]
MKHCPSCVSEFQDRPDLITCPECQVALQEGPSPAFEEEGNSAGEESEWETVYTTSDEAEAYIVQGFLKENGLPAVLESTKFHAQPVNLGLLSEIKILCPLDNVEEARILLEDMSSAYVCSACGTACSILDSTCPNCGESFQIEGN